jgi:hypothetical protein
MMIPTAIGTRLSCIELTVGFAIAQSFAPFEKELAFWFAAAKMPNCACPQTIRLSQGAFMLRKNSHPKMCEPMIAPGKDSTFSSAQTGSL